MREFLLKRGEGQRNGNAEQHITTKPERNGKRMCIWQNERPGEVKKEDK